MSVLVITGNKMQQLFVIKLFSLDLQLLGQTIVTVILPLH